MRPTYTIADIFETPGRARVLRALALAPGPMSIRAVGRAAGISHTAAGSVLRDLEAMGLVSSVRVGRATAYALRQRNAYVRHMVLPAVEAEDAIVREVRDDLVEAFATDSVSLILFGSYAYGGQDESSDIDVFALAEDARRKQMLEERALEWGRRLFERYGSPLSLLAFTRKEAAEQLGIGKSAFRLELESTGIILHGLAPSEWGTDEPEATAP